MPQDTDPCSHCEVVDKVSTSALLCHRGANQAHPGLFLSNLGMIPNLLSAAKPPTLGSPLHPRSGLQALFWVSRYIVLVVFVAAADVDILQHNCVPCQPTADMEVLGATESSIKMPVEKIEDALQSDTAVEAYSQDEIRSVVRKLDWHLMPLCFILYTFSVLDRSNIGNAKLAGMSNDIDLSGNKYNWLGTA